MALEHQAITHLVVVQAWCPHNVTILTLIVGLSHCLPVNHSAGNHNKHHCPSFSQSFSQPNAADRQSFSWSASCTVLLPPMEVSHVLVQIPHACERMVGGWTSSYPAILRTFMVRIVRTIGLVFHPGFIDSVALMTEGTDVTALNLGR